MRSRVERFTLVAVLLFGAMSLTAKRAQAQDLNPPPIAPPISDTPPSTSGATQPQAAHLDAEEKKDSGRGLEWVFLNADAGFSYINLTSLSSSNLLPAAASGGSSLPTQSNSSQGPKFGVGAGIRLLVLTLGAHASLNELSAFNLYQFDGELGIHIPIGHWEPYFGFHGGYCFVGSLDAGLSGSPSLSISGGDAGAQIGLDYYFNHFVSIGLEGAGSAYFLHRPPTALPTAAANAIPASDQALYQQSGDSVGIGGVGMLKLGFHL